jgi:hypothetical protein
VATKSFKKEFEEEAGFEWRPWRWASKGLGIIVMLLVVSGLISAAVWTIGVATSDTKGRGEQIKQNNSNLNRTEQQAAFEDLYAQIVSLDQRIDLASDVVKSDEAAGRDSTISRQNLVGAENVCLEAIGTYNANSHKTLAKDWQRPDLPDQIDQLNPATDCKPIKS